MRFAHRAIALNFQANNFLVTMSHTFCRMLSFMATNCSGMTGLYYELEQGKRYWINNIFIPNVQIQSKTYLFQSGIRY